MNPLYGIFGAAGCGRGILPLARAQLAGDDAELVFVDDGTAGTEANGHPVLSFDDYCAHPASGRRIAIAIADGGIRRRVAERCEGAGVGFFEVRAANVVQMDDVEIGEGALISPFVAFTSNIRIGRHFHCNLHSYVEHDCEIGDFVTFAPGVRCNGNIVIGDGAYIGAGAVLRQGKPGAKLHIGAGAVVGMGAVVLGDVPAGAVVVGNPARILRA